MYQPSSIRTLKKLSEAQQLMKNSAAIMDGDGQDDSSSSDHSGQEDFKLDEEE